MQVTTNSFFRGEFSVSLPTCSIDWNSWGEFSGFLARCCHLKAFFCRYRLFFSSGVNFLAHFGRLMIPF